MRVLAHGLRHRKAALHTQVSKVVEEDAAHAARLITMLEKEVFVAPGFEARIKPSAEGLQRIAAALVEVARVFLPSVVRRQIHAAAEPGHRLAALGRGAQHAHVHVNRGHVGIARVHHE